MKKVFRNFNFVRKIMKTRHGKYILLFVICLIIFSIFFYKTEANIIPNIIIVDFKPNDSRQKNIEVYNDSDEIAYMSLNIQKVLNPGTKNERRILLEDKKNLIVVPNKTSLKSKSKKIIRFISTENNLKEDSIYRVSLIPKVKGVKGETGIIGIKILLGYEVLVIVRPKNTNFDIKAERNKKNLIFRNNGNTNVLLNKVSQCDKKGQNCQNLLHKRLYAGNEIKVTLPYSETPVICEIYYADKSKKEVF